LSVFDFPPSPADFPFGALYRQSISSIDPLVLEPMAQASEIQPLGRFAEIVARGELGAVQVAGNVTASVLDRTEAAGRWIWNGFEYVANLPAQAGQALVNLYDSAVLQLRLRTTPPSPSGLPVPQGAGGDETNTLSMAWLPIHFPTNATAMAFDFKVEGDPVDDVMVFGIAETNLFSLEAKYIPTNTISSSRLIDVSLWAGTTNELFFGFMGGTSTNATLIIENIRFYSLKQPRLEIVRAGSAVVLAWPLSAGGYGLETTTNLATPVWDVVTNAPVISASQYVLTNSGNAQILFYRLRQR
jgi:hypothetical protein